MSNATATPEPAELLQRTIAHLSTLQYAADGPTHFRGEFPMWLDGPVSRVDHNYLSGYALLHIALASHTTQLPGVRAALGQLMRTATDLPARYQSPGLTGNWYSGRGSGLPAPANYPWPEPVILCLRDDYDDTAITALLTALGPFRSRAPLTAELFAAAAYDPAQHTLVPKSLRRLQLSGGERDIYQSWVLPDYAADDDATAGGPALQWLPQENSIELSTVANVYTAVHLLAGNPAAPPQRASKQFINALTRVIVGKLLAGDASYMDFASSYYPRVPFAPLSFLLHNHVLTSQTLLEEDVLDMIVLSVTQVDPQSGWRLHGFANPAYWLNCCAWCIASGLLDMRQVRAPLERVWQGLAGQFDQAGRWPDIVFFYGAHLGHYSGGAYAQAMMAETLALLHEVGFA